MSKPLTCTNHCSQCGRHFHSLRAFDAHHERDETGWPQCLDPLDLEDRDGQPRLVVLGVGECRMYRNVQSGVQIWTRTGFEATQDAFEHRDGPESCPEASRRHGSPRGGPNAL